MDLKQKHLILHCVPPAKYILKFLSNVSSILLLEIEYIRPKEKFCIEEHTTPRITNNLFLPLASTIRILTLRPSTSHRTVVRKALQQYIVIPE